MNKKIEEIIEMAARHLWIFMGHKEQNLMVSFCKGRDRINVFYTTMTVATCINHPKHGRTQLFRKYVDMGTLERIFINPRTHTDKGYFTKKLGGR